MTNHTNHPKTITTNQAQIGILLFADTKIQTLLSTLTAPEQAGAIADFMNMAHQFSNNWWAKNSDNEFEFMMPFIVETFIDWYKEFVLEN